MKTREKNELRRRARLDDPMPVQLAPMLTRLSGMPADDDNYGFEIKWDGVRAIIFYSCGKLRIQSRSLADITHRYPELHALADFLDARSVILDGEIIALNAQGRPSFELMQQRLGVASVALARKRMEQIPTTFMAFDVLYLDGRSLMNLPYVERRELLDSLSLSAAHWQAPPYTRGEGAAMLQVSREQQLEGIVAKRLDSKYELGQRSGAWRKIKNKSGQEFVIAGWLAGEGSRQGKIGSILLGVYDYSKGTPRLLYAGKAGTGFTDETLNQLAKLLAPLRTDRSPFEPSPSIPRGAVFTEPRLVGEFEYTEWTQQNILRHPSFKGLRTDRSPLDVVREDSAPERRL